jgi:hypothetical protein
MSASLSEAATRRTISTLASGVNVIDRITFLRVRRETVAAKMIREQFQAACGALNSSALDYCVRSVILWPTRERPERRDRNFSS